MRRSLSRLSQDLRRGALHGELGLPESPCHLDLPSLRVGEYDPPPERRGVGGLVGQQIPGLVALAPARDDEPERARAGVVANGDGEHAAPAPYRGQDDEREVRRMDDLTFGAYLRILQDPDTWSRLGLGVDRATFVKELDKVRVIVTPSCTSTLMA
jgi:hypothetical protein